ncbi:PIN domain-containing protein [Halovenus amylolytica]|uniref:PIN domain-containing protein n=1 Tax=Halovenus amylolytica TaxID=2500550 RepID=UPI002FC45902
MQQEVETLRYYAEFVDPDPDFSVVDADPDDDKFFETAVAGHADHIVSGDQHLLDVESFKGIDVLTPREFYEILTGSH